MQGRDVRTCAVCVLVLGAAPGNGYVSVATVHLAAVPHVLDPDRPAIVVNCVQDAAVAVPDPEDARQADNRFHACRPGFSARLFTVPAMRFLAGLSSGRKCLLALSLQG